MSKISQCDVIHVLCVWLYASLAMSSVGPLMFQGTQYDKGFFLDWMMSFGILFLTPILLFVVYLIVVSPYIAWKVYKASQNAKQKDYDDFVAMCRGDKK